MGHFDGRLQEAVNKAIEKAISKPNDDGKPGFVTQGAFYDIFKKHDFFDVADTNNKLTPEQRAQVPLHAQYRYSNFANAIAEMLQYFFTDKDVGILNTLDNVVLKLDSHVTMTADATKSLGKTMEIAGATTPPVGFPNPALASGGNIMKIKEYLTGLAMGVTPFDKDILSPNLSGFGFDYDVGILGNLYSPGFIVPDWNFLYEYEYTKSPKFYQTGEKDSGLKIGCNIDVGQFTNDANLVKIFGVVSVESITKINGNIMGGVTGENFKIIQKASKLSRRTDIDARNIVTVKDKEIPATRGKKATPAVYVENDAEYDDIRNLTLNENQIRCSFYNLVELKFWNVIKNRQEWAHGHWGALVNNDLPDYVRTAVCSYVWSKGLAIDPKTSVEAALISYLLTIGLYYKVGRQYPVRLMAIPEVDVAFVDDELRSPKQNPLPAGDIKVDKLPKNGRIAKIYWQWIADIIVRSTNESAPEEIADATRKRRVAEANLIYKELGSEYEMGGILSSYHTETGLLNRKFDRLLAVLSNHDFYRYGNSGSMGAAKGKQLEPSEPKAILKYAKKGDQSRLEAAGNGSVVKILRHLLDKAYVQTATITSTVRGPKEQATAMYENLNKGTCDEYASPGRAVVDVYLKEKIKLGLGDNVKNGKPIPFWHKNRVIDLMTKEVENRGPSNVSMHCGTFDPIAVVDIGPASVKYYKDAFTENNGKSAQEIGHGHFINTFYLANKYDPKLIHKFYFPNDFAVYAQKSLVDDPAFHIEININTAFDTSENNALPDIPFRFKNKTFENEESRKAPFAMDSIRKTRSKTEEST